MIETTEGNVRKVKFKCIDFWNRAIYVFKYKGTIDENGYVDWDKVNDILNEDF